VDGEHKPYYKKSHAHRSAKDYCRHDDVFDEEDLAELGINVLDDEEWDDADTAELDDLD
jgi:hypothetical protein